MMQPYRLLVPVGVLVTISLAIPIPTSGQTFSSGSTGADGALDLTSGSQTIQVPPSGVFNYTTVNIPVGTTLTFQNNLSNTPVIMLAQGAVNIAGTINVSASGQNPGPGGFRGGDAGQPGWGPGAGSPVNAQPYGIWIGPLSLVPNIGGSGSSGFYVGPGSPYGWNCWDGGVQPAGGGGGGAITLASSASITVSGAIVASGDSALGECNVSPFRGFGGPPGAIRLVANANNVSGSTSASVFRMEAPAGSNSFTGSGTTPVIATINPLIVPANPPSLQIVSIGGYQVPPGSGSGFSTIDLLLPNQLQDPIAVVVQATNVPVGSPVTINFSNSGGATYPPVNLAGTTASSGATVYVSNLNRNGVSYLFVSTTFSASLVSKNLNPFGPTAVNTIELATALGRPTRYRFLKRDGSEISPSKLPPDLKLVFGL